MGLVEQIVASFQPGAGVRLDRLDPNDERALKGREMETLFTLGVALLKERFPEGPVRSLAHAIWDVFHHRRVVMALGPPVPSLTLAAFGPRSNLQAMLLTPHNWPEMVRQDPIMQLGGIVFTGSQAVDFYNDRILLEPDKILSRGRSYEAEMLRIIQPAKLNHWQKGVVEEFPNGFDPAFAYERKPVEPMS